MASDVEIDRILAVVATTLNDQGMEAWDPERVQRIVTGSLGGEPLITVDAGGGLHERGGARIGALRRTPSGEWIAERQNDTAKRSDTAIPSVPPDDKG